MLNATLVKMRKAHKVLAEFKYDPVQLDKGYAGRSLRIDISSNTIEVKPVSQEMKNLWTGGKGFDLWMMFKEINKDTKWNSPENPICMSSGPLGGTASFPGSGKTLVTSISPATQSVMDCNVGGYFGPYLKFAGFDALCIVGKASKETIIYINAPERRITIEEAPHESVDSHVLSEELTNMYAESDLDKRSIAVVSSGTAANHTLLGMLNFSFFDWRRKVPRLKQAGRGGIGTVFRNKHLKALVVKGEPYTPKWRVSESKVTEKGFPTRTASKITKDDVRNIAEKYNKDKDYIIEMMLDIQAKEGFISKLALDILSFETGVSRGQLYHNATFYKGLSLAPKPKGKKTSDEVIQGDEIKVIKTEHQHVLRNWKAFKSDKIEDAMAKGVYETFSKLVKSRDQEKAKEKILEEISEANLRGRGGEGRSAGRRWQNCKAAAEKRNEPLYIGCNADEGDPASFKDRAILESDPHSVIEGMLLCAFATDATEGFIFVRHNYTRAIAKFEKALKEAHKKGLLGEQILGSKFNFDIKMRLGAGAYVEGGYSAMMAALSGKPAEPVSHYSCQCEYGYQGHPTILHNVETFANVPLIMENGAEWFTGLSASSKGSALKGSKATKTKVGKNLSPGTKIFSLNGHVKQQGLVEVPMDATLRDIVEGFGGGVPKGKKLKAIQIGGPSGGFLPESQLDIKADFDALAESGVFLGSGSVIAMDEGTSVVDATRATVKFCLEESCGKCTTCREGLFAAYNTLTKIAEGQGKKEDLDTLNDLSYLLKETSLCSLGQNAANPIESSLRYFKKEYDSLIKDKKSVRKMFPGDSVNAEVLNVDLSKKMWR